MILLNILAFSMAFLSGQNVVLPTSLIQYFTPSLSEPVNGTFLVAFQTVQTTNTLSTTTGLPIKNITIQTSTLPPNTSETLPGGIWTPPVEVVSHGTVPVQNPAVSVLPSSTLALIYQVGETPQAVYGAMMTSTTAGATWSAEALLPAGILGVTPGQPVVNPNYVSMPGATGVTRLIYGSWVEAGDPVNPDQATACWVQYAPADLSSWTKAGPFAIPARPFGAVMPVFFQGLTTSEVHFLCSDKALVVGGSGNIWQSTSFDFGATWSTLTSTGLPNPNTSISTVQIAPGKVLLFYNPSSTSPTPLVAAYSADSGATWTNVATIDSSTVANSPSAMIGSDGQIHVVYSVSLDPAGTHVGIRHVVYRYVYP